ncbi:MAG: hypothetical protein OEY59_13520 [Deltaproteobacteria bacterium]|nr:hypothetical protein [Deltaproteobacteria bacterium]
MATHYGLYDPKTEDIEALSDALPKAIFMHEEQKNQLITAFLEAAAIIFGK